MGTVSAEAGHQGDGASVVEFEDLASRQAVQAPKACSVENNPVSLRTQAVGIFFSYVWANEPIDIPSDVRARKGCARHQVG